MAVTFTSLDTNSSTANQATPYITDNITPTANQPVLLAVMTTLGTTTPTPTVTGCGLTWTLVDNTTAATRTQWLFLGIGASPTTGALSIAGDGTSTITSCLWQATQCAGVDTSTANGVVQHFSAKPATSTAVSVAFGSAVTAGNATYGVIGTTTEAPAQGTGWSALGSTTQTVPTSGMLAERSTSAPQQNVSGSWTTTSVGFVVGVELAALVGAFGTQTFGTSPFGGTAAAPTVDSGSLTAAGTAAASLSGTVSSSAVQSGALAADGTATASLSGALDLIPSGGLAANGVAGAGVAFGSVTSPASAAGTGTASISGIDTLAPNVTANGIGAASVAPDNTDSGSAFAAAVGNADVTGGLNAPTSAVLAAGVGTANLAVITGLLQPPTGVQAATASSIQVTLLWNAAGGGVTTYDIERDGVVIASGVTGTTYFDTGLVPGTVHAYRVRSAG